MNMGSFNETSQLVTTPTTKQIHIDKNRTFKNNKKRQNCLPVSYRNPINNVRSIKYCL